MYGTFELYMLSVGETSFNGGRKLKVEFGFLLIVLGILLSYVAWIRICNTDKGWSQVPYQLIAIVAVLIALKTILDIAANANDSNNFFILLILISLASSWWVWTKYIDT
jgi:hypothetical protein